MSRPEVVRVRHVMQPQFDIIDGMASVEDALDKMKHPTIVHTDITIGKYRIRCKQKYIINELPIC